MPNTRSSAEDTGDGFYGALWAYGQSQRKARSNQVWRLYVQNAYEGNPLLVQGAMSACASDAPPTDEEGVSGDSTTSMQESHFPAHRHVLGTAPGSEHERVSGRGTRMEGR